jgi:protein-L-isoaspartate(D-aspartate) O-methyltransferase
MTIDLEADLVEAARRHLTAAGFERVQAVVGDGALGWSREAPFDRILLTAAAWDVAPAWFEELAEDGRVVLPLMLQGGQASVALVRSGDHLESISVHDCGFMPIRGPFGYPGEPLRLGPRDGLFLVFPPAEQPPVSAQAVYAWLSGPCTELPSGVRVAPADVWKVAQWLALRDPASCFLWALGADAEHHLLPLISAPGTADNSSHASGLVSEQELALLAVGADSDGNDTDAPVELVARSYGELARLAARMVAHIREWQERGRTTTLPRRIRVYSRGSGSLPTHDQAIERKSSIIVVDWD